MKWPMEELRDWASQSLARLDRIVVLLDRLVAMLEEEDYNTYEYDGDEGNGGGRIEGD